jgi:hypothetical protein
MNPKTGSDKGSDLIQGDPCERRPMKGHEFLERERGNSAAGPYPSDSNQRESNWVSDSLQWYNTRNSLTRPLPSGDTHGV